MTHELSGREDYASTVQPVTDAFLLNMAEVSATVMSVFDISRVEEAERRDSLADAERDRL